MFLAAMALVGAQIAPRAVETIEPIPRPPQLASWTAGPARCGEAAITPGRPIDPAAFVAYGSIAPDAMEASYGFTLSADGRPLDIKRVGVRYLQGGEDLSPSLAAARFASAARIGCTIRFTLALEPIATAPIDRIFAYAARPQGGLPPTVLARLKAAGGECFSPGPAVRERAFPDIKALPKTPGAIGWTVTRFDIGANGKPVRVERIAGSGNAAFDRAAVDAIRRSRFEAVARQGCLWPTGLRASDIIAPPAPSEAALKPEGATCPDKLPYVRQPSLTMPEAYRRRGIEGWAVIAYDVAPWGATGNARVLAAQPAAEFGDWALNVVRNATKPASNTGYVGCIDRVFFRMGDEAKLLVNAENGSPVSLPKLP